MALRMEDSSATITSTATNTKAMRANPTASANFAGSSVKPGAIAAITCGMNTSASSSTASTSPIRLDSACSMKSCTEASPPSALRRA